MLQKGPCVVDISDLPNTRNLVELLLNRADAKGNAPFLWAKHGGEWQALSDIVLEEMGGAAKLSVPLEVQIGRGPNWNAAAH